MSAGSKTPQTESVLGNRGQMKPTRLFQRIKAGSLENIRFRDLVSLIEALGFRCVRVSGSHHIYTHSRLPEIINLQAVRRQAKPYQIRQLLRLVDRYNLSLEHDREHQ